MCHKTVSQICISLLSLEASRCSLVSGVKYYPKIRCSERGLYLWPWGDPQPWNTTEIVLRCWPVPVAGQGLRWGLYVGLRLTLKTSETTWVESFTWDPAHWDSWRIEPWFSLVVFIDEKKWAVWKFPFGFSVQNPSVGFMLPKDCLNGWENFRV